MQVFCKKNKKSEKINRLQLKIKNYIYPAIFY